MNAIVDERDEKHFRQAVKSFRQGDINEQRFKQLRLVQGVYLQRQAGRYMLRVRVPWGGLTAEQVERIADLSDIHAGGVAHITTRQNLQFYNMNLKQVCEMIHYLAEVGITTRESSGNVVRNITVCSLAGSCQKEFFDVAPYADLLTRFLIRAPQFQNLPRKFKISFSGCQKDCGYAVVHDLGFVACAKAGECAAMESCKGCATCEKNGKLGFKVLVGGGLGASPRKAEVLEEFIAPELLIPTTTAVLSVFDRLGTRDVRAKARLKFLVEQMGIAEFRRAVFQKREELLKDNGTQNIGSNPCALPTKHSPKKPFSPQKAAARLIAPTIEFLRWKKTNVEPEHEPGSVSVKITVPLGDITSNQLRLVAQISNDFSDGTICTTNGQNLVLSRISEEALPQIFERLNESGLGMPCAHRLCDIASCAGTSLCPSAFTNSKALAAELIRFFQKNGRPFQEISATIKISGCANSCGQHQLATLGLSGRVQMHHDRQVPSYELYLGAQLDSEQPRLAEPVCKIPSRRLPAALSRMLNCYEKEGSEDESLDDFISRKGTRSFQTLLASLTDLERTPPSEEEFKDWGDEKDFQLKVNPSEC